MWPSATMPQPMPVPVPVEMLPPRVVDEAAREQCVHSLGDGRAGEPGHPGQVGARDGYLVADQMQERPGVTS
jgi:hypothetical protein